MHCASDQSVKPMDIAPHQRALHEILASWDFEDLVYLFSDDARVCLHYSCGAGGRFDVDYLELETLESLQQLAEMTGFEKATQCVKKELTKLWRARTKGDIVGGVRMRVGSTRADKNRDLREDVRMLIRRLEMGEK